VSDFYI